MKFQVFAIIAMLLVAVALAGVQADEEERIGARGVRLGSRRIGRAAAGRRFDGRAVSRREAGLEGLADPTSGDVFGAGAGRGVAGRGVTGRIVGIKNVF